MSAIALEKFTLREVEKLSEAEILFANCEQDNGANHVSILKEKIDNGKAVISQVIKDGKTIGYSVTEIYGDEFAVLALAVTDPIYCFESLFPFWVSECKKAGCRFVSFSTVRPGLIKQSLKYNFKISRVEMRHYVR